MNATTTSRSSRRTVVVHDEQACTTLRLSLGAPAHGGRGSLSRDREIGTGVFARALWIGRKYVVLLAYSQWVTRTGECTGDTYRLCDVDDARMIRRIFGDAAAEAVLDTLRTPVVTVDGTVAS
jgi:hypothetical protein